MSESLKLTRHNRLAEWIRHLTFKPVMIGVVSLILFLAEILRPCYQFYTKMPEKSDLCYLGKTRLWHKNSSMDLVAKTYHSNTPKTNDESFTNFTELLLLLFWTICTIIYFILAREYCNVNISTNIGKLCLMAGEKWENCVSPML